MALDFERADADRIQIPDSATVDLTTAISIDFWIKPESVTAATVFDVVDKFWDGTTRAYAVSQSGDEIRIIMGIPDGSGVNVNFETTDFNLVVDTWSHIAMTWSVAGGTARVYKDGVVSTNTGTKSDNCGTNTRVLMVGGNDSGGSTTGWYDGVIDEVRVWNKELTSAEVNSYRWRRVRHNENGVVALFRLSDFAGGIGATASSVNEYANAATVTITNTPVNSDSAPISATSR